MIRLGQCGWSRVSSFLVIDLGSCALGGLWLSMAGSKQCVSLWGRLGYMARSSVLGYADNGVTVGFVSGGLPLPESATGFPGMAIP